MLGASYDLLFVYETSDQTELTTAQAIEKFMANADRGNPYYFEEVSGKPVSLNHSIQLTFRNNIED